MTRQPRFFLGVFLIIVFVSAAFFYRNEVLSFLNVIRSLDYEKMEAIRLENLALKAELGALKDKIGEPAGNSSVVAKVYSRYPFNDRRLITIALGEKDGLRVGMPVLAMRGVLLGKIKKVFGRQSLVETLFDPAWRSSVIISPEGVEGTRALLEGGAGPTLTLISKESTASPGDQVFNTSPEFPLELLLGEVGEVKLAPDDIWLTAELRILYDSEDLSEVLVVTSFP